MGDLDTTASCDEVNPLGVIVPSVVVAPVIFGRRQDAPQERAGALRGGGGEVWPVHRGGRRA